ncbi:SDR family NAD(P)-dependent oxidoreductase [Actinomadura sp. 6K520]|uniref:SDR family NAD(P)-dependent oxidoreductase n=1 Tax=Actinomadura sp. 6K520 TaxID=2530364 RepID=UPI00104A52A8|nr:SDR family NAD(P)-dependent oxidoreductase [Actinomadura sp. 6K520]TDE27388.1 SDR family NAD(P)-dependent oxidoreductase [Actinomadura sp. 6K520]
MTGQTRPLAVVTGASSGIGRELAGEFARHGHDVLMAAEDAGIVEAARAVGDATPVRVDLATYEGVEELYAAARAAGRAPAAVALNAGVGVAGGFARDNDLAAELNLVSLNVTSAVHLARRVLPDMIEAGSGRLLVTSSVAATGPGPYQATYAASKAFLYSFAQALRQELSGTGVTVTALLPGPTETEFFTRAGLEDTKLGQMDKDDPAQVAREAFEALMAGKDHVVAGSFKNRMQVAVSRVVPDPLKAKAHGKLTKPGSAGD